MEWYNNILFIMHYYITAVENSCVCRATCLNKHASCCDQQATEARLVCSTLTLFCSCIQHCS